MLSELRVFLLLTRAESDLDEMENEAFRSAELGESEGGSLVGTVPVQLNQVDLFPNTIFRAREYQDFRWKIFNSDFLLPLLSTKKKKSAI